MSTHTKATCFILRITRISVSRVIIFFTQKINFRKSQFCPYVCLFHHSTSEIIHRFSHKLEWSLHRRRPQVIFFPLASLLGSSLTYWSAGLITQFLDLSQAVGLLGRVVSSSQGLYLNTGQHKHRKTRTHIKHPCPGRNSNPQSRPPSDRRLFMLQTARLPRSAKGKAIPVQAVVTLKFARGWGSHNLDIRLTDGGKVVSLTRRPHFTPRKIPGTHFC
jgi:hypothetical protein